MEGNELEIESERKRLRFKAEQTRKKLEEFEKLEKLEKLASKLVETTSNMLESAAFQDGKASETAESVFQPAFLESASQGAESSAFQEWKASRTAESALQVENYYKEAESVAFKELKLAIEAVELANQEWKLASEVAESASNGGSGLASLAAESAFQKWKSASQLAIKLARSTFQGRSESAAFQGSESALQEWNLASQVEESAFPGSRMIMGK